MDRRRAVYLVLALLLPALALAQTPGPPAYTYSGAAPSGACTGQRVWINTTSGAKYCCTGTTWALCDNATTATALAANPTDCSAGQYANAIDASGNLTCATPAGGAGNFVEVDVDFGGPWSDDSASTVVTGQTWVTATSKIICAPTMLATTTRAEGAEDATIEGLVAAAHTRVAGTGFTVTVQATEGLGTTGVYKIHCTGGG